MPPRTATLHAAIEIPYEHVERFCQKFHVQTFALFGSVLREDFGPQSDVDVLLEFQPGFGFTFENTPQIDDELRDIFHRKVDVIELNNVRNPLRRKAIEQSCRVIHVA